MIYQTHPTHGLHMPTSAIEAKANIKRGWKTVTEDEFYGRKDDRPALVTAYTAKFGKTPPKNIKLETLKAKLDE